MAKLWSGGVDELPFADLIGPLGLRRNGRYESLDRIPVPEGSDFGRNQRVAAELIEKTEAVEGWAVGFYASSLFLDDVRPRLEKVRAAMKQPK